MPLVIKTCPTACLSAYHFLEYIVTALWNPGRVNIGSFLLGHSVQYWLANLATVLEFIAETVWFSWMKASPFLLYSRIFGISLRFTYI